MTLYRYTGNLVEAVNINKEDILMYPDSNIDLSAALENELYFKRLIANGALVKSENKG